MARTGDLRIRVNRAEMRALKAAAKALGGRPVATWARDTLLAASKAALPVKPAPSQTMEVPGSVAGAARSHRDKAGPIPAPITPPRAPLVKTYDPDQS